MQCRQSGNASSVIAPITTSEDVHGDHPVYRTTWNCSYFSSDDIDTNERTFITKLLIHFQNKATNLQLVMWMSRISLNAIMNNLVR